MNRRGFTLIELLVVIAILSLLLGMAAMGFSRFRGEGEVTATKTRIHGLAMMLETYHTSKGDYPSGRLSDYGVKPPNAINQGIEAMVLAFVHKDYNGQTLDESWLENKDQDRAVKNVTRFGEAALFEVVDAWDNPITYQRYDQYETEEDYEFVETATGEVALGRVKGQVSDKTGSFHDQQKFQLRSAGEDGVLGTSDDITSY